jgi:glutaredoxin 3
MNQVRIYKTAGCPYCDSALRLLDRKGVQGIAKVNVDESPDEREKMMKITGRRTVPQIFIGDRHVGGYDDLVKLDRAGKLDELLNTVANTKLT